MKRTLQLCNNLQITHFKSQYLYIEFPTTNRSRATGGPRKTYGMFDLFSRDGFIDRSGAPLPVSTRGISRKVHP